ncbi:MAG: acetyl-CoA C-acetyltransferase [Clostridiales bacterium]|nr:acetyl-CoA C-acetyltransferase [Oscillospiraceae bacterium]MDD5905122.1 acetyl-CoA C-acetyltransferase [Clostridiales bacterium]
MKDLYVVNCCRTAIGSFGGSLKNTPAAEMGAIVVKEALKRANIAPENVDELMFGCILTAAQGQNVARQVSIKAGIPYSVPAYTVGMVCGSGMKSVIEGARSILAGDSDIVVCGGTENMSAAPYASMDARWGARMGDKKLVDTMIKDGLWDAYNNYHMGTTAENINDIWGISRAEQDAFAAASQQKTEAAMAAGKFDEEIVAVPVKVKKAMVDFKVDEYPKAGVTVEGIAKLRGAFPVGPESPNPEVVHTFEVTGAQETEDKGQQRVTAANASGINDGAAAIVLASGEAVAKYGLKPMAKLIGWGQGGVDPKIMGVGPVPASRAALAKAGLTIDDIDLVEANEAFAAQSIAVARELHFDMSKVNVNGGAISLGHPVGASGARIIVTLLHELKRRDNAKTGLATLCIGGGMGVATVFEKC